MLKHARRLFERLLRRPAAPVLTDGHIGPGACEPGSCQHAYCIGLHATLGGYHFVAVPATEDGRPVMHPWGRMLTVDQYGQATHVSQAIRGAFTAVAAAAFHAHLAEED